MIEGVVTGPPCSVPETVQTFKIGQLCDFIKNVSANKEGFLKLMKFTKQSPVYMEEDEEYNSELSSGVAQKYGYIMKKNIEVCFHIYIELQSLLSLEF